MGGAIQGADPDARSPIWLAAGAVIFAAGVTLAVTHIPWSAAPAPASSGVLGVATQEPPPPDAAALGAPPVASPSPVVVIPSPTPTATPRPAPTATLAPPRPPTPRPTPRPTPTPTPRPTPKPTPTPAPATPGYPAVITVSVDGSVVNTVAQDKLPISGSWTEAAGVPTTLDMSADGTLVFCYAAGVTLDPSDPTYQTGCGATVHYADPTGGDHLYSIWLP